MKKREPALKKEVPLKKKSETDKKSVAEKKSETEKKYEVQKKSVAEKKSESDKKYELRKADSLKKIASDSKSTLYKEPKSNKPISLEKQPDFKKGDGLIPVIIQDEHTLEVLMLGYMNNEALQKTLSEKRVTFFSRTKNRLWTKGEESGNFLELVSIHLDCDQDTLLLKCIPKGATCHTGDRSCFKTDLEANFILELENIIKSRYEVPQEGSYVNKMRTRGINKIAQKVGEEAVEMVIAALVEDRQHFIDETSDLLFHMLFLLREKKVSLNEIGNTLKNRHEK